MGNKVLVIEDEPVIGEMMCMLLEDEGYKVISLNSTDWARNSLPLHDVSLVTLDLNLGKERGDAMCRYIKSQPELSHIAVMLVSGSSDLEQIKVECGADDALAKPFSLEDFTNKVRAFTKRQSA
ncbi:response regulator [Mucilaginibacter terrenus]|uniref:Response regulator n=1 Tax=Mucilaginibacter terrenus TaxID=2482727 RepID=A0A3E2NXD8_9SPHI|nr:response regulator [Mucilaginibacter terrenus]RFZ85581.1 response regulator [Mucilaginibacter terrenus]